MMQTTVHYSVSLHSVHSDPSMLFRMPSRAMQTSQPHDDRAEARSPSSTPVPDLHSGAANGQSRANGFLAMKDAARHDFFTIRADAVQDGALALLDSLAEYLVWDGMDRRLRATASATHTDVPEAVVSVQQIANDIKVRVGHDLCERTVERALKKLCDVGLLLASARFHQGRRQASSYQLLFAPSMAARLAHSRRDCQGGNGKSAAACTTVPDVRASRSIPAIPEVYKEPRQTEAVRETVYNPMARIGDCLPALPAFSAFPAPGLHSRSAPSVPSAPSSDNRKTPADIATGHFPEVCRSAHPAPEAVSQWPNPSTPETLNTAPAEGKTPAEGDHPTSLSPLFKKEKQKQKKKAFQKVVSISDFSKNRPAPETTPLPDTSPDLTVHDGYFLDTIHQQGWVRASNPVLLPHLGDLSRAAFFAGCHTLEALQGWFQQQENDIAAQRTTLARVLVTARIQDAGAPSAQPQTARRQAISRKAIG